jgi:alpha-tubulin suppressor-like RCC1 family protein
MVAVFFPFQASAASRAIAIASAGGVVLAEGGHVIVFRDPINLLDPVEIRGAAGIVAVDERVALRSDGRVLTWEEDCRARTDIEVRCRFSPALEVTGLSDVVAVAAGEGFFLALCRDGTLWGWGDDSHGQLSGRAAAERHRIISTPILIPIPEPVIFVAAGWRHALALTSDSKVFAWGEAAPYALGIGSRFATGNGFQAVIIDGLPAITRLSASSLSYALTAEGQVWQWGVYDNTVHQFGYERPSKWCGGTFEDIRAGHDFALALDAAGRVFACGSVHPSQLGQSGMRRVLANTPILVESLPPVVAVSARASGAAALDRNGDVWAWGRFAFGPRMRKINIVKTK